MDHIGQHLLAHAALAGDQHPAVGRRNQRGIPKHRLHQRAPRHDIIRQGLVLAELQGNRFGDAGRLLNRGEQLIEVDRFREIIHRAIAHRRHRIPHIGERRHQQHRQRRMLLARFPQRVESREPRHPHVRNHHVELGAAQQFQGAFARIRHHGFETLAVEE